MSRLESIYYIRKRKITQEMYSELRIMTMRLELAADMLNFPSEEMVLKASQPPIILSGLAGSAAAPTALVLKTS